VPPVRPAAVLALLCLTAQVAAAGCGGSSAGPPPVTTAPPVDARPAPGLDPHILPPKRVPKQGTHAADPTAVRVIQAWVRALRRGDLRRAASYFAVPLHFQNGTPVLTVRRRSQVLRIMHDFPCGAIATKFAGAGRYTLVRFRLTSRVGGDCHGAEGNTTGGAILVQGGRIHAWYRLYDPEEIQPPGPLVDPGDEKL
jgi:limonene-1,2-epoxide hydrolase